MNRRAFLLSGSAGLFAPQVLSAQDAPALTGNNLMIANDHPLQTAWTAWKALCLSPDGRVIDSYQNNISHSEGQGYGLTLAAIFGDRQAAEQIISWTDTNLALRPDQLLAWRWQPDTVPQVVDRNNASDGDLFYAWGLMLLAQRLNRPDYLTRAGQICTDILRRCTKPHPDGSGRMLLLPGASGFQDATGVTLNPSYYMPRAMRDLALATGLNAMAQLAATGQSLIDELSRKGPVPDWVRVTASGMSLPPNDFAPRSGYEAMRVTLFQIWSGEGEGSAVRAAVHAAEAAGSAGGTVTVWSLPDGAVLERSSHEGYAAIAGLASCTLSGGFGALMPAFSNNQPYYPATLHLMSLVAQATTYPRCVPI